MSNELTQTIENLGRAFEAFKDENDKRLKEIESKGHADPQFDEKLERINAELAKVSEMKKQIELLDDAMGRIKTHGGGSTKLEDAKGEHRGAWDKWMRKGVEAGLRDLEIRADLSTLSDPDGGFLVPEEVETAIDRVAETVSAMRRICTVKSIGTDTYKKLVGQGGAGSGWVAEKGSRSETDTPTLKEIAINTKELYANPAATQSLLDDSRIDIADWLAGEVAIEFNEKEADAFINGNGVEKPKGIAAYTMVANASYAWGKVGYIASGAASTFTNADKLIDLQHALKSAYRTGALWLMNDATQGHVRKFKDGEGNYLWRPGLEPGAPNTLLGKPVEIDDNLDDIGASKYPIFFGNFKRAYCIVDRLGVRVLRDPYTNKPYTHFYTTKRVGGGIVMYEALKALKVAAS